jgi:predicted TIM-barrel fold metal-dependent hydrolase
MFRRRNVWERPNIFADTALAPVDAITDYLERYGHSRLMFGSDFPFGDPASELRKIFRLNTGDAEREDIIGGNVLRLIGGSNRVE